MKHEKIPDWHAYYHRIQKVIKYSRRIWNWPSHIYIPVIALGPHLSLYSFVRYSEQSNGSGTEDQSYWPRFCHLFTHSAHKYLLSAYHGARLCASETRSWPAWNLLAVAVWPVEVTLPLWVSCSPFVKWWQIYLYPNYENSIRECRGKRLATVTALYYRPVCNGYMNSLWSLENYVWSLFQWRWACSPIFLPYLLAHQPRVSQKDRELLYWAEALQGMALHFVFSNGLDFRDGSCYGLICVPQKDMLRP